MSKITEFFKYFWTEGVFVAVPLAFFLAVCFAIGYIFLA